MPPKLMVSTNAPLHLVWLEIAKTLGVGFTTILNCTGNPVHEFAVGIMETIEVSIFTLLVSLAVNELRLSIPDIPKPIEVSVFVHAKLVFATAPPMIIFVVATPLQMVTLLGMVTFGVGSTTYIKLRVDPWQPLACGVTIIVAVSITNDVLVAANELMFPVPVSKVPILVRLLVQVKVVAATAPVNLTVSVFAPLQRVWLTIESTFGVGKTMMVKLAGKLAQLFADAVTVSVAVSI